MGTRYRADIVVDGRWRQVEQTFGQYTQPGDARDLFQVQFPGCEVLQVQRVEEASNNAHSSSSVDSGTSGLLALSLSVTLIVTRYLPLLVLFIGLNYLTYEFIKSWHPVIVVLTLATLTAAIFGVLSLIVSRVSKNVAAGFGALSYFAGLMALKALNWHEIKTDWLWTSAIACLLAGIGGWSFASSHDLIKTAHGNLRKRRPDNDGT